MKGGDTVTSAAEAGAGYGEAHIMYMRVYEKLSNVLQLKQLDENVSYAIMYLIETSEERDEDTEEVERKYDSDPVRVP